MSDDDYDLQDDSVEEEEELDDDGEAIDSKSGADAEEVDDVSAEDLAAAAASAHSSLAARNKIRESLQSEIEAFLARGGKIQQVENNIMADPPKKPTSNYGNLPI